jgi:hypothetical protein
MQKLKQKLFDADGKLIDSKVASGETVNHTENKLKIVHLRS